MWNISSVIPFLALVQLFLLWYSNFFLEMLQTKQSLIALCATCETFAVGEESPWPWIFATFATRLASRTQWTFPQRKMSEDLRLHFFISSSLKVHLVVVLQHCLSCPESGSTMTLKIVDLTKETNKDRNVVEHEH